MPDAGHALVGPVDPGRALVRGLEDAVQRPRVALAAVVVDGGGARVGDRGREAVAAGRLEHVHRADDVDGRAERRVRLHERHLQRGEVDHVRDLVLRERPLELLQVGDVAADEGDLLDLVGRRDQLEPVPVVAEVVRDDGDALADEQRRRPGPDAAERAGDEEPVAHVLTLSLRDCPQDMAIPTVPVRDIPAWLTTFAVRPACPAGPCLGDSPPGAAGIRRGCPGHTSS